MPFFQSLLFSEHVDTAFMASASEHACSTSASGGTSFLQTFLSSEHAHLTSTLTPLLSSEPASNGTSSYSLQSPLAILWYLCLYLIATPFMRALFSPMAFYPMRFCLLAV